jgi:CRP/FNR family transcriptional regulator, anaerobic regulatory protein
MATALMTPSAVPPAAAHASWFVRAARVPEPDALQIDLRGLTELLGGTPGEVEYRAGADRFGVQRVARGAMLVHEGAPAAMLYVVQSGSFKCVQTAEDGYEHVLGFAWRHDVIGYDGLSGARYAFAAVALEDSRVVVLRLASLAGLRQRAPAFDAALQSIVARQLTHAGEIARVMAAVAADARLARFLMQLSSSMAERGQSPRRLLLRMNRRDIANHLGLAHETISRSLRLFADAGWLRVDQRELEILDPDALRRCARSTRGPVDEAAPSPHEAAWACAA